MTSSRFGSQHTAQSFGDFSRFLREGVADEETRELRESLGSMSQLIDEAVRARREGAAPQTVLSCVLALARAAREHQVFLTSLGSAWHALYEFGAYQSALREFRSCTDAWQSALQQQSGREQRHFARFELLAWRTLGDALLLIDMYEQGDVLPSEWPSNLPKRRRPLLARLRAWLRRER